MSEHGGRVTPKTEPSDYPLLDEHHPYNTNGGLMDQSRTPTFPLLGIQGTEKYSVSFKLSRMHIREIYFRRKVRTTQNFTNVKVNTWSKNFLFLEIQPKKTLYFLN